MTVKVEFAGPSAYDGMRTDLPEGTVAVVVFTLDGDKLGAGISIRRGHNTVAVRDTIAGAMIDLAETLFEREDRQ